MSTLASSYPPLPTHRLQSPSTGRPLCVLVACGSFSPLTYVHLRMFEEAKNELMYQRNEFDVVGGFLSPVHDSYGKKSLVDITHRAEMCLRGVESSSWLSVAAWEAQQQTWIPTIQVLDHYSSELQKTPAFRGRKCHVKLLCGSDVVKSFIYPNIWNHQELEELFTRHGVVCLERSPVEMLLTTPPDRTHQHDDHSDTDYTSTPSTSSSSLTSSPSLPPSSKLNKLRTPSSEETSISLDHKDLSVEIVIDHHPFLSKFKDRISVVYPQVHDTTSATLIRKLLAIGHSVKYLIPDSVLSYIHRHRLYSSSASASSATSSPRSML